MKSSSATLIRRCEESADERWTALGELLQALRDPRRRSATLTLCQEIRREPVFPDAKLRIRRFPIRTANQDDTLDLLLTPEIFAPEDWSLTFLEGLLRRARSSYAGLRAIEVGTGSGFISLAVLRSTSIEAILGVDINPIAVTVAEINAILNSYDDQLQPRTAGSGGLLFERFEARTSNVLADLPADRTRADLVVSCIPQVPAEPAQLEDISEQQERLLRDYSDYYPLLGCIEDAHGLGLVAATLDQARTILDEGGIAVLNVAGRPGMDAVNAAFLSRGYAPRSLWHRRIEQAADTDISALVELERHVDRPFEFYVESRSGSPISAATALELLTVGRSVWHDLHVIEARLPYGRELRTLEKALRSRLRCQDLLEEIDLSGVDQERLEIINSFSRRFLDRDAASRRCAAAQGLDFPGDPSCDSARVAPYTHESGDPGLRDLISLYVMKYHGVRLDDARGGDNVFVAPNRESLVEGLVTCLCEPGDTVLVTELGDAIYRMTLGKVGAEVLVVPDELGDAAAIVAALSPKAVLAVLGADSALQGAAAAELVGACQRAGAALVFDASIGFDISSHPLANPTLERILALAHQTPVLIAVGLLNDRSYPELAPAFALGAPPGLRAALEAFAEASFSRNDTFTEDYYAQLFGDVLGFQLDRTEPERGTPLLEPGTFRLSDRVDGILAEPPFREGVPGVTPKKRVIRLDYGENERTIPDEIVQGVLLAFADPALDVPEADVQEIVAAFRHQMFGDGLDADAIVLAPGSFPLLRDITFALAESLARSPRIAVPRGAYGYVRCALKSAGAQIVEIPTVEADGWMLTREQLMACPSTLDAVWLNHPLNPTGIACSEDVLAGIARAAGERNFLILADEIFRLLPLGSPPSRIPGILDLGASFPGLADRVVVLSGLAKAFAAGGLRSGYALFGDRSLATRVREIRTVVPSRQARIATHRLFRGFLPGRSADGGRAVRDYLESQASELRERRDRLVLLLHRHGLRTPDGVPAGLFLQAKLGDLRERTLRLPDGTAEIIDSEDTLHALLYQYWGLRINTSAWSRTPGWNRICFSVNRVHFEEAIERLRDFLEHIE